MFNVFVRTWWRLNHAWPNGLEPCPGNKRYLVRGVPRREAFDRCQEWNATHKPGRLSRKAEFEECRR
jgi:hypothetical protein